MNAVGSRIVAVVVALGLVAAAWLVGDGGSARAALGSATGPLVATDPGGAALLVASGLAPGGSRSGEVTVTNVGDAAGAFVLSASDLVDTAAPLSTVLDLAIEDVTAGRTVYDGPLDELTPVDLGSLAQNEARRYRFTVSFPSAGSDEADNAFQGASSSVTFVWTATGSGTSGAGGGVDTATDTRTPGQDVASTTVHSKGTPKATLTTRARQYSVKGRIATSISCQAACTATLTGTATSGTTRARLKTVRRTLAKAGAVRLRVKLPAAALRALAHRRTVEVSLRLTATMGTRVVTTRTTVRVLPARR
jgi:hypothetical protein